MTTSIYLKIYYKHNGPNLQNSKKLSQGVYLKKGSSLTLLDIGIGNARIARHLSAIPEMWQMIETYEGTDNAEACIKLSRATAKELNIEDKLKIHLLDAIHLDHLQKKYDLIICTWFTPGNFYPDNFSFEDYNDSCKRLDLPTKKLEPICLL